MVPELFLAPRGLITVLLFFELEKTLGSSLGADFQGVLLFVILGSCLVMSWSLIRQKKRVSVLKEEGFSGTLKEQFDHGVLNEKKD